MTPPPQVRDEQAVRQFVERFAAVLVESGVPPMPARAFSALLATDSARLTAAGLAGQLEASPAAISGAVRYLAQLGMISREREPGSRRDVYRVLDDVWHEVWIHQDQLLSRWAGAAREGVAALGPDTPAGQRVADALDFFEFLLREMPSLLARWRAHAGTRADPPGPAGLRPAGPPART